MVVTDYDRIVDLLEEHGKYSKALANDLLQLLIDIAGEHLMVKEKAKAEIYESLLTNKFIKQEHQATVYSMMKQAKERTQ